MGTRDFISIKYHRDWFFSTPIQTIDCPGGGPAPVSREHQHSEQGNIDIRNKHWLFPWFREIGA